MPCLMGQNFFIGMFFTKKWFKSITCFFNNTSKMEGIFNSYILNNVTYKQLYEKIKNLSVKIK